MPAVEDQTRQPVSFPERIGRYELLLPVGTGGMATVYLARMHVGADLQREVALKLMHTHLRGDPDWADHFLREARLATRVRHPNVVPVLEVGDDPMGIFLVLEYVEGDTLAGLIRAARSVGEAVPSAIGGRILADALTGLHAAHELKSDEGTPLRLVHRDFSPQNLLVGVDGSTRLTDFGVAKAATGDTATSTGIVKGKLGYMAPEQARAGSIDRRCDVWAAGVIAWELLANRRLYGGKNEAEKLMRVVTETPPRLRDIDPHIPRELDAAVARALTIPVSERTSTARELRRELVSAWQQFGGIADPDDVSSYVKETSKSLLAKRREQVDKVLRLRARMARVSGRAIADVQQRAAPTPDSLAVASAVESLESEPSVDSAGRETGDGITEQQWTVGSRLRGRRAFAAGAAGAAIALVGAFGVWRLTASQVPEPQPITAPTKQATTPPSANSAPLKSPAETHTLAVNADAPISALRVGRRRIPIQVPARRIEVELIEAEHGRVLQVEAKAADGRSASSRVSETVGSVTLRFEPLAPPSPTPALDSAGPRPRPTRKGKKPGILSGGLAPMPGEK